MLANNSPSLLVRTRSQHQISGASRSKGSQVALAPATQRKLKRIRCDPPPAPAPQPAAASAAAVAQPEATQLSPTTRQRQRRPSGAADRDRDTVVDLACSCGRQSGGSQANAFDQSTAKLAGRGLGLRPKRGASRRWPVINENVDRASKQQATDDHTKAQPSDQTPPPQPQPTFISLMRPDGRPLRYRNPVIQTLSFDSERNSRAVCNKHMPWFGIDVGGTLVKVVFFDPKEASTDELVTLKRIRQYLHSAKPYGSTGRRDTHLEMPNCLINNRAGSLHFIRFATSEMPEFLAMAKNKRFAETLDRTICATGGGACKFEAEIRTNLGIKINKTDELDSIIYGIHYIDKYNSDRECYFLEEPLDDERCLKVPYDFSRPYPYLVVNIGSGVGILAVYSSTSYSRISGSSIGGGTFLGLCCLLTQCETFDEAIRLAKAGSSSKVDKLVKDIYGGDYTKFNLSGDTVASNFGHMNLAAKRKEVTREDLARALLEMVTINIGSIARMCAVNEGIDRVVFIGNFLRVNQLSMRLLSYAVNYWSKGTIKALFLEHEGYFGAVGCFVESTQGCPDC